MGYSSGHHFWNTQKHTFLSQTKHTGLAACVSAKHPLLLQWNLSEITAYMKNTVPQKLMPYKKLSYLNCSHSLPPWKRPWQAPKACVSAWVTNPLNSPSHSAPVPSKSSPSACWSAWGGRHLPSWGIKINQNGGAHGCASEGGRRAAHLIFERSPPGTGAPAVLLARAVSIPLAPASDCCSSQGAPGESLTNQPLPS